MVEAKSDRNDVPDVDFVALPAGAKVGRYEVLAVLGQGGFGITYRARDARLNREVALKEYLPTSLAVRRQGATVSPRSTRVVDDFTRGRDRFVAEGRTLASLHRAPGIVQVFDFLEFNDTAYIVMELLGGETLDKRLKAVGRLDPSAVEQILWTLLDGLEQVHDAGFLHRDIKPSNIVLDEQGLPTLIDFGAARAAMAGHMATATAIFTPGYAAAEQMSSAEQGPWTDIYGLAATLYHAIAGKAPPSAVDRMLDDRCDPLSQLAGPGYSPGVLAGLEAGLAVRASDRPQSIAAWRTVLAATDPDATIVMRVQAAASTAQAQARPSQRSRTGAYLGGAVAALLLAGGGAYLAWSASFQPRPVALQDIKVEDLKRLLTERRAVEAAAIEKRRLEEETRCKAEADAAAKRQADADLARAQQQLRTAEQELARLRGEIETSRQRVQDATDSAAKLADAETAKRRAEAEVAALRQAEHDARQKAAREAEAKRRADDVLAKAEAERLRADSEASRLAKEGTSIPTAAISAAVSAGRFDGAYSGTYDQTSQRPGDSGPRSISLRIVNDAGSGNLGNPACGSSQISIRITPAGDIAGEAVTFDGGCQRLPVTVRGRAEAGRLQLRLSGAGISGGASLTLAGAGPAARPASAIAVAPPAPVDTRRWVGRIKCGTWSDNGLALDLSSTGGQATSGLRDSTAFSMTIDGGRYSATIRWTIADPIRSFSGTFSGMISGDRVVATTIARSDFKTLASPPDDQCTLELARKI